MDIFPTITVTTQPDNDWLTEQITEAAADKTLLVIYDGELGFLERVLAAAGYADPKRELHLIRREADDAALDLTVLCHQLGIRQVILFGQELPALGLHFNVAPYAPIEVGGRTYLVCESAVHIAEQKELGNNKPAGALWAGVKSVLKL